MRYGQAAVRRRHCDPSTGVQQDWTFADSVEAGVVSDAAPRFIWMANKETDLRRGALIGARQPSATSNPVTLRVWRLNSTPIRWIGSPRPRYLAA